MPSVANDVSKNIGWTELRLADDEVVFEGAAAPVGVEEEELGADLAATDGLDVDLGEETQRQGRSSSR